MMFLIGILVLTILSYKFLKDHKTDIGTENPLDILQKKYAKGKIDEKEFERKKQNLQRQKT